MRTARTVVCLLFFAASALAQSEQETLSHLFATIQRGRADLAALRTELDEAKGDVKKGIEAKVAKAKTALEARERRFESIATGVDIALGAAPEKSEFDLKTELESLLEPLVQQLKNATETPRQIEQLRQEIALAEQSRDAARKAVSSLESRVLAASGELRAELAKLLEGWRKRRSQADATINAAQLQLETKLASQQSLLESTGSLANSFFRQRGLNFVLALGAFLLVFFGLRLLYQTFHRVQPLKRRAERTTRSFLGRLGHVLFHAFVGAAAVAAMLLVLYATNDWVLLVLMLVFLFGIGWASIQMLPKMFEQIRLILNLGSVREGERITWEGLPYRVASLGINSVLENPALDGGWVRLPVRDLIGRNSRPTGETEAWFPCEAGDWVLLADGTRARVVTQTPEVVQMTLPGGGPVVYRTTGFLDQSPKNLSRGFRVELTFGIDYEHQAIATTTVPQLMHEKLARELLETVSAGELIALEVEFKEAAASSLDFEIQGDFAGSAAERYEPIERAMARILVDACNEHGWGIPFTQVTLHQA